MKKIVLSLIIITATLFTSCKTEKKESNKAEKTATISASFGVRGNCGMCKKTIENAATSVDGVAKATWDKTKKKIDISFDETKTNVADVEKAIAASGYDTENTLGSASAYQELPACCKYDHKMKMNQTKEVASEEIH